MSNVFRNQLATPRERDPKKHLGQAETRAVMVARYGFEILVSDDAGAPPSSTHGREVAAAIALAAAAPTKTVAAAHTTAKRTVSPSAGFITISDPVTSHAPLDWWVNSYLPVAAMVAISDSTSNAWEMRIDRPRPSARPPCWTAPRAIATRAPRKAAAVDKAQLAFAADRCDRHGMHRGPRKPTNYGLDQSFGPSGPPNIPNKQSRVGSGGWPDEEGPVLADPGCTSGGNVAFLVANEDRTGQVEIEVTGGGKDQSRLGFATLAVSLRGIGRQRMVGTCVDSVQDNPPFGEHG